MKKKKRNPQDATLRNINALKKRVAHLSEILSLVITWQDGWSVSERERLIRKLEAKK
jgi:hypothetical protein